MNYFRCCNIEMMERKQFLKLSMRGMAGLGLLANSVSASQTLPRSHKIVGFNHLPEKNNSTMKTVFHPANGRGHANHGWLDSHHSFSFANYYNPERMNFGVLRVLNDDQVAPGRGFGTHPHENMEIISIPLEGDLEHKDSMGNAAVIKEGDVQVMSAGTGVYHSEYNKNKDREVKFLQIWMFPNQKNVEPRYGQISLEPEKLENRLEQILSPNPEDEGVWVHQNAWFHLGRFDALSKTEYQLKDAANNGVYLFVLEGEIAVGDHTLKRRDALGIWDTERFAVEINQAAQLLLMEIPLQLS